MRLFNEQVDTMTKLKGKGGQQRVVVEHVTVAAGGQAIVRDRDPGVGARLWRRARMNPMSRETECFGNVTAGGRMGSTDDDRR